MTGTILFWVLFGGLAFAFALALQMRVITAHVLRKALEAHNPTLAPAEAGEAVRHAGKADVPDSSPCWLLNATNHLVATYPRPLNHLRLARRASLVLPVTIFILLAGWRLLNGGF